MAEEINIKSGKGAAAAKKKSDISAYTNRTVLEFLQQNGCTHANLETVVRARRGNTQKILDFFCQSYANAEQAVNQDCNSVSLNNINHWLELLNKSELSNLCEYESAAVLNAIRRNEPQPEPEQLEGIDMSEAYTFLENALTGQPQKKLSEATEKFMAREVELLIAEANTEESDSLALDIGQQLSTRQDYNYEAEPHRCSLDPLFLNDKEP